MKKGIVLIFLGLLAGFVATCISGCGAADRWEDGPPKYNSKGEKVDGDDLYIEEYLKQEMIYSIVASLRERIKQKGGLSAPPVSGDTTKWEVGYIVNRSYNRNLFNVSIYIKGAEIDGLEVGVVAVEQNNYLPVHLPPGDYVAIGDGGKFYHTFTVGGIGERIIQFRGQNLSGTYFLYKE